MSYDAEIGCAAEPRTALYRVCDTSGVWYETNAPTALQAIDKLRDKEADFEFRVGCSVETQRVEEERAFDVIAVASRRDEL